VSISDNRVLQDILELLIKRISDDPESVGVDRAIIQATLQISPKQVDDKMSYLAERNLVALAGTASGKWSFAKITADGIDVVENKKSYADKFSFAQTSINQITSEDQDETFKKSQTKFSFNEKVSDTFKQASDQVLNASLSIGEKAKIEKQLKALEKELLKTKKIDLRTVQKEWDGLKKNADWLSPTLASLMLEGIRVALDLPTSV
jgi:hypothetical protein